MSIKMEISEESFDNVLKKRKGAMEKSIEEQVNEDLDESDSESDVVIIEGDSKEEKRTFHRVSTSVKPHQFRLPSLVNNQFEVSDLGSFLEAFRHGVIDFSFDMVEASGKQEKTFVPMMGICGGPHHPWYIVGPKELVVTELGKNYSLVLEEDTSPTVMQLVMNAYSREMLKKATPSRSHLRACNQIDYIVLKRPTMCGKVVKSKEGEILGTSVFSLKEFNAQEGRSIIRIPTVKLVSDISTGEVKVSWIFELNKYTKIDVLTGKRLKVTYSDMTVKVKKLNETLLEGGVATQDETSE